MANVRGKSVDKTFLSIDRAGEKGFIHRDYIAHCLRWQHVVKYVRSVVRGHEVHVLDIGCGRELPLAKTLYTSSLAPTSYVGVDYGPVIVPAFWGEGKKSWRPTLVLGDTDAALLKIEDLPHRPNTVTCFEVLEHVEPRHCRAILKNVIELVDPEGVVFLSTPCYDERVGAADNHVNEMTYLAFGALLEEVGFSVEGHWGTFASIRDYKDELSESELSTFNRLREYYDTQYLATILAPLFPHRSRNVLWRLSVGRGGKRLFKPLSEAPRPWGSSARWEELAC